MKGNISSESQFSCRVILWAVADIGAWHNSTISLAFKPKLPVLCDGTSRVSKKALRPMVNKKHKKRKIIQRDRTVRDSFFYFVVHCPKIFAIEILLS